MTDFVEVPSRTVPVIAEVDVLVVGGGPAGCAAAISAARLGAKTMLVERYGYLGGLATGSLVVLLADMYQQGEITVAGIVNEFQDRLSQLGGLVRPAREEWFQKSPALHKKWYWWGFLDGFGQQENPAAVTYSAQFDIETGKQVLFQMIGEAKVKLQLHSWCTGTITEEGQIKGIILFSKAGYQAIRAKIIIDTTGDGDVFASAGADFMRGDYMITISHYVANVDTLRLIQFTEEQPEEFAKLNQEVRQIYGGSFSEWFWLGPNPGILWCDCPHFNDYDALNVEHLTYLEVEGRQRIWKALDFIRKNFPGCENVYISRTADQIGVRQSRMVVGEYVMTLEDIQERVRFMDSVGRGAGYTYPYRALVPKGIDNLLVAGRHISLEPEAQIWAREWPPCMVTGQAAGTAAALALESNVLVRDIDIPRLQEKLTHQGVIL